MNNRNKDVSNVRRIQGTNDNSILSKASMINHGYFNDPYLPLMTGKTSRRAPLINRGYYIRAKAIDFLLNNFIEYYENENIQIVSLGAGFDTSFFRLTYAGKLNKCCFVEIDYFDVAQRKVNLMQQEPSLWSCLKDPLSLNKDNYIILNAANYKLLGVDITKLDVVDACIRASEVSYDVPTLFLSECVITYISTKKAFNLLRFIAKSFTQNSFILYEQIHPEDGFGKFMCHHFQQLGSSLRGISKYKTKQDQIKRFLDAGWENAYGCDMSEFYYDIVNSSEKSRIENLEVFDEYEEWLQKCGHYLILVASKGMAWIPNISQSSKKIPQVLIPEFKKLQVYQYESDLTEKISKGGVKAHYTKSALIYSDNDNEYLMRVSGYGQNPFLNGHCRLGSISILDIKSKIMSHIVPDNFNLLLNSLCGSMTKIGNNSFILFGGRSSPLKPNNFVIKVDLSFDNVAHSWKAVCNEVTFKNPECIPSDRWRHAAGIYYIHNKPFFFVYGGRNSNPRPLSDTHILNLDDNHWVSYVSDINPGPLASCSVVSLGLKNNCKNESTDKCCGCCCMLLFGGLHSNDLIPSGELWRWCGRKNTWTKINVSDGLFPRFSHTSHIMPGTNTCQRGAVDFISFGGVSHKTADCGLTIVKVDLLANTAYHKDFLIEDYNNLECVMYFNHSSALPERSKQVDGNKLWLVGGGGNCFSFGTQLNENIYFIDLENMDI